MLKIEYLRPHLYDEDREARQKLKLCENTDF